MGAAVVGMSGVSPVAAVSETSAAAVSADASSAALQTNRGSVYYGSPQRAALLDHLRIDSLQSGMQLTHEMNTEDLDGNLSTSFYVNGDPHHYIVVYRFAKESTRLSKIRSLYGTNNSSLSPLIRTEGNMALVYLSSGTEKDKYSGSLQDIFERVLAAAAQAQ